MSKTNLTKIKDYSIINAARDNKTEGRVTNITHNSIPILSSEPAHYESLECIETKIQITK